MSAMLPQRCKEEILTPQNDDEERLCATFGAKRSRPATLAQSLVGAARQMQSEVQELTDATLRLQLEHHSEKQAFEKCCEEHADCKRSVEEAKTEVAHVRDWMRVVEHSEAEAANSQGRSQIALDELKTDTAHWRGECTAWTSRCADLQSEAHRVEANVQWSELDHRHLIEKNAELREEEQNLEERVRWCLEAVVAAETSPNPRISSSSSSSQPSIPKALTPRPPSAPPRFQIERDARDEPSSGVRIVERPTDRVHRPAELDEKWAKDAICGTLVQVHGEFWKKSASGQWWPRQQNRVGTGSEVSQ